MIQDWTPVEPVSLDQYLANFNANLDSETSPFERAQLESRARTVIAIGELADFTQEGN